MADTRTRIQQNDLLLHEAVIKNEPAAVREALERPTDVNCRNNVSITLQMLCCPSTLGTAPEHLCRYFDSFCTWFGCLCLRLVTSPPPLRVEDSMPTQDNYI